MHRSTSGKRSRTSRDTVSTNPSPFFSVLLPYKDAEETLQEAIDSIIEQSFSDWELILINDHSEDSSLEQAHQAASRDSRIRLLNASERGIVSALNEGLRIARGPWIARMDADDRSHPERLKRSWEAIQSHPGIPVFSCLVKCFPESTAGMAHYMDWLNGVQSPDDFRKNLFVESPIAHPSAIVKTEQLREVGGYRDGDFPEDYDLWLRQHRCGARFFKIPEVLFYWRESPDRLSRTDTRYRLEAFRSIKAEHLRAMYLANNPAVQIWGAGPDGKAWAKCLEGMGVEVRRFFDIDPKKIGGRIQGKIPVLHWKELQSWKADCLTLGAVGAKGAREKIRQGLPGLGIEEGEGFIFVQ